MRLHPEAGVHFVGHRRLVDGQVGPYSVPEERVEGPGTADGARRAPRGPVLAQGARARADEGERQHGGARLVQRPGEIREDARSEPGRARRGRSEAKRAVFVARQVREDAPRGREVAPRAFRGRCRPLRELVRRVGPGRDGDGEELEHE